MLSGLHSFEDEDEEEEDEEVEEVEERKPRNGKNKNRQRKGKKTREEKIEAARASTSAGKPSEEHATAMQWADRIAQRADKARGVEEEATRTWVEMTNLTDEMEAVLKRMRKVPWPVTK